MEKVTTVLNVLVGPFLTHKSHLIKNLVVGQVGELLVNLNSLELGMALDDAHLVYCGSHL